MTLSYTHLSSLIPFKEIPISHISGEVNHHQHSFPLWSNVAGVFAGNDKMAIAWFFLFGSSCPEVEDGGVFGMRRSRGVERPFGEAISGL
jgi:hypothetical protein